jgi:hypothetical protein
MNADVLVFFDITSIKRTGFDVTTRTHKADGICCEPAFGNIQAPSSNFSFLESCCKVEAYCNDGEKTKVIEVEVGGEEILLFGFMKPVGGSWTYNDPDAAGSMSSVTDPCMIDWLNKNLSVNTSLPAVTRDMIESDALQEIDQKIEETLNKIADSFIGDPEKWGNCETSPNGATYFNPAFPEGVCSWGDYIFVSEKGPVFEPDMKDLTNELPDKKQVIGPIKVTLNPCAI